MTTTQTTTAHTGRKESNMDFSTIPAGCLPAGTVTPLGIIEQVSLTAYRIGSEWVPFRTLHGTPRRADALAIPQAWVDAITPDMAARMDAQSRANIDRMIGGAR